ncbi:tetratricopeptide repeat protein [Aeromonas hydrophila]|uniref:tetratricopeptide repeat protein n=1 Tax=Aeromonas hydrophila TaxID=644 RepID=UPI001655AD8F|nr:tetratricopeptide repeat protein [Aeromonas hydrophila]MBC8670005.1 tetratricopeptide repeat protein [Aeromonas hydrophila]MBC8687345.1 tetratricopeptide repeat protein [Aeromonas hydrophila]
MDNASQQYNVSDLAKFMCRAKDSNKPFVFFTGAGCSVTSGIPLAKKLIEEIHKHFETELKLLVGTDREDYGKCMAQIGRDDRRRFLKSYIDEAKINWAHIALACLLREGYIGRVLTFNFDNLLARSCGLLGLYPATYDFTAANLNLYHLIDNPAVVHLHGQSHGFAQLNSDRETAEHAAQLSQFVCATLNESPALFIGYSGQADAFFPQIKDHFSGQHRLFWVDMAEQAPTHIADSILQTSLAHYMRCADGADLFLIELAQQLDCFPPMIFTDPYAHQLEELEAVTPYPQRNGSKTKTGDQSDGSRSTSTTTQDILQGLRQRLKQAQQREYDERRPNYLELYLQGKYSDIIKYSESVDSLDISEQVWVAKAYFDWALSQTDLEQGLTVYDKLVERFGTSDVPLVQEQVVKAILNKGVTLGQLNHLEDEIKAYDDLIQRVGTSDIPKLQGQVADALFNKGIALGQLDRIEDEIAVYDELIQNFNTSDVIEVQEQIALALFNKGVRLGQRNSLEEEVKVYDTLIQRFNKSDIPVLQEHVAKALLNKGFTLDRLGHSEDAITVYNELIQRFGSSDEPRLQEQVAKAFLNKGVNLGQRNLLEDEITIYDELIQHFGTSNMPALEEPVTKAMVNKGVRLGQLGRSEDAITVYDEIIQRFGSSDVPAVQEQVAKARHLKGLE